MKIINFGETLYEVCHTCFIVKGVPYLFLGQNISSEKARGHGDHLMRMTIQVMLVALFNDYRSRQKPNVPVQVSEHILYETRSL